jgi:hypothetical protein
MVLGAVEIFRAPSCTSRPNLRPAVHIAGEGAIDLWRSAGCQVRLAMPSCPVPSDPAVSSVDVAWQLAQTRAAGDLPVVAAPPWLATGRMRPVRAVVVDE